MKRLSAVLLILCLMLGISACGKIEYETFQLLPNEFLTGETIDANGVVQECIRQYTQEDIQRMNDGKANMVFGNQGYLSFLQGRFSDH